MTISKKDLITKLSLDADLSTKDSNNILSIFISSIKKHLIDGDQKISNFGSFLNKQTPERLGRNPKTKEIFTITKRNKISFKISSKINKYIN